MTAGEIANRYPITAPSISRHLSLLKAARLVQDRREGNRILYSLENQRIALSVGSFLSTVCPSQMVLRALREPEPDNQCSEET